VKIVIESKTPLFKNEIQKLEITLVSIVIFAITQSVYKLCQIFVFRPRRIYWFLNLCQLQSQYHDLIVFHPSELVGFDVPQPLPSEF